MNSSCFPPHFCQPNIQSFFPIRPKFYSCNPNQEAEHQIQIRTETSFSLSCSPCFLQPGVWRVVHKDRYIGLALNMT